MDDFWVKRYDCGETNKNVLLIFPHWGSNVGVYRVLARFFPKFRVRVYQYADSILSSDLEATTRNFAYLEKFVLSDVSDLRANGSDKFLFLGNSLGVVPELRIANQAVYSGYDVTHVVLNISGAHMPYAIWNGCVTRDIRKSFNRQGISFSELDRKWGHLSPIRNLDLLQNSKILFYACLNDDVIVRSNVALLVDELRSNHPNAILRYNRFLRHKSSAIFNMLNFTKVRNFLES